MADQIVPPSTNAPLTAEDAAIIRAEKQLDEDTRGRLVQVYGESKTAMGKRIALQRPMRQAWRCPACHQMSDDIRRVCGNCLAPEATPSGDKGKRDDGTRTSSLRPGTANDADVQMRTVARTGRTYRQFTDVVPGHRAAAAVSAAAPHEQRREGTREAGQADVRGSAGKAPKEDLYDDEPDCGEETVPGQPDGEESDREGERRLAQGQDGTTTAAAMVGAGPLPEVASGVNKEKHLPPERGSPFTHFVSLPIGKLPAVAPSANALLTPMRAYLQEVAEAEGRRQPDRKNDSSSGTQRGNNDEEGEAPLAWQDPSSSRTHLSPQLLTSAAKMHVTLLLLSLPTQADVAFAKELLGVFARRWADTVAAQNPPESRKGLAIRFKGLHVMPERGRGGRHDRGGAGEGRVAVNKAAVVYMGLRDDDSTRQVAQLQTVLHECFAELISEEHREEVERTKLNLHMTVMNKKWRRHGAKRPFDAKSVLEKFGDAVVFGDDTRDESVVVPHVELNRMSSNGGKADTYFVECTVPL